MICLSRNIASNLLQVWRKYKLREWLSMVVGGVIFVVGYVLGTISWRRGASGMFVVLDIFSGTVGFVYFCFKGLQIFSEAHEELIALLCNEHHQIVKAKDNQAVENDYVLGETVFSHIHEPKQQSNNTFCDDLKSRGQENHPESNHDRRGNLDYKHYENSPVSGGQYAEDSDKMYEERIDSSEIIYAPRSMTEARYVSSSQSELRRMQRGVENGVLAMTEMSQNSILRSPRGGQLSSPSSSNSYVYHETSGNYGSSESHYNNSSGNSSNAAATSTGILSGSHEVSLEQTSAVIRENQPYFSNQQQPIQCATSEILLSSLQRDFMPYYQSPKTISLSSPCLETPDPCRHLKPAFETRKQLPPLPTSEKFPSNSENMSKFFTPGKRNLPIPTYQLQSRKQSLQPCLSLPVANQSPVPVCCQFQTSSLLCNPPPTSVRSCEPLTRHMSHPLKMEWSQSPPRLPYWSTLVAPRYSPGFSRSSPSISPESPSPRRRPSPPSRGRSIASRHYLVQSPPTIPRKMRSSR